MKDILVTHKSLGTPQDGTSTGQSSNYKLNGLCGSPFPYLQSGVIRPYTPKHITKPLGEKNFWDALIQGSENQVVNIRKILKAISNLS